MDHNDGLLSKCQHCMELYHRSEREKVLRATTDAQGTKIWCRRCRKLERLDAFAVRDTSETGEKQYFRACTKSREYESGLRRGITAGAESRARPARTVRSKGNKSRSTNGPTPGRSARAAQSPELEAEPKGVPNPRRSISLVEVADSGSEGDDTKHQRQISEEVEDSLVSPPTGPTSPFAHSSTTRSSITQSPMAPSPPPQTSDHGGNGSEHDSEFYDPGHFGRMKDYTAQFSLPAAESRARCNHTLTASECLSVTFKVEKLNAMLELLDEYIVMEPRTPTCWPCEPHSDSDPAEGDRVVASNEQSFFEQQRAYWSLRRYIEALKGGYGWSNTNQVPAVGKKRFSSSTESDDKSSIDSRLLSQQHSLQSSPH